MTDIFLIRQTSPLRAISEAEAVEAISVDEQRLERRHLEIEMSRFGEGIEEGDWSGQDLYLREMAGRIKREAIGGTALHYFGLAEVPQQIALGAHVGDQYAVVLHDFDRDTGLWRWPHSESVIRIATTGDSGLSLIKARGPAVIRVAISALISDADVRDAVGDATLADVAISHHDISAVSVTRVRSAGDVETIRQEFRRVYALVRNTRPNMDMLHLFVAAPPSVCFAIGQELQLRNSPPVQLYRFRKSIDGPSQQPAILLTAAGEEVAVTPLLPSEVATAAMIRGRIWPLALKDLETYTLNKEQDTRHGPRWFDGLQPKAVQVAAPFPPLPLLETFLPTEAIVDQEVFSGDFGFEKTTAKWKLGDRLLLGLFNAVGGDEELLRQLIRLFLFHEYLHLYHTVTKHTAEEVGKFANCLEFLDYTADTYAIIHQLDLARRLDGTLLQDQTARRFLAGQVELAIRSFWAFDYSTGSEWQVRRLRRYLNWYWRLVQLENARDLPTALRIFRRPPAIEIGGLFQVVRGRRVIALLERLDSSTHLELGLVLENDRFFRVAPSPNTNLPALLHAFCKGEHESIKQFFRSVYDLADPRGVQPVPDTMQPSPSAT